MSARDHVHATAVAFGADAVLIRGPSGAGKSDLALRLLALPRKALAAFGADDCGRVALVADDRVELARQGNDIVATSPASLRGMLEVRGIGIVDGARIADRAVVRLVVDLVASGQVERMPREGPAQSCLK